VEVLPDVGHFAHVEAPTEVVDLIDEFITSTAESVTGSAGFRNQH
jgi:hypothetical protein